MRASPDRDMGDMDGLMEAMRSALSSIEDILVAKYTDPIQLVLDEWECTKDCITEMKEEIEELESGD